MTTFEVLCYITGPLPVADLKNQLKYAATLQLESDVTARSVLIELHHLAVGFTRPGRQSKGDFTDTDV